MNVCRNSFAIIFGAGLLLLAGCSSDMSTPNYPGYPYYGNGTPPPPPQQSQQNPQPGVQNPQNPQLPPGQQPGQPMPTSTMPPAQQFPQQQQGPQIPGESLLENVDSNYVFSQMPKDALPISFLDNGRYALTQIAVGERFDGGTAGEVYFARRIGNNIQSEKLTNGVYRNYVAAFTLPDRVGVHQILNELPLPLALTANDGVVTVTNAVDCRVEFHHDGYVSTQPLYHGGRTLILEPSARIQVVPGVGVRVRIPYERNIRIFTRLNGWEQQQFVVNVVLLYKKI